MVGAVGGNPDDYKVYANPRTVNRTFANPLTSLTAWCPRRLLGRPNWWHGHSNHLLSGLARSTLCGSPIRILSVQKRYYGCGRNLGSGVTACSNGTKARREAFDAAGIATIAALLQGDLIAAAVERAIVRLAAEQAPARARL